MMVSGQGYLRFRSALRSPVIKRGRRHLKFSGCNYMTEKEVRVKRIIKAHGVHLWKNDATN